MPHPMTEQLDATGKLRHLLTLDGLPRDVLERLLDRADALRTHAQGGTGMRGTLAGKAVCTLFFEPSTRTRSSFQLAATRLGADALNFDASVSSTTKGETASDTLKNIEAMGVQAFVIRHQADGAVAALADDHRDYGLGPDRLRRAAPDAVVLHPGPMNRGVEIDDAVADGGQSLILRQVANGVAVRMAVLEELLG